ncbi:MAG: N-acetylmuramoyl-L-alanine amidase [Nitrospirota bacterium]
MFLKKRELRLRRAILKGVYEDNLRIVGKWHKTISWKTPSFRKIFLLFSIIILTVLGHLTFMNFSSVQGRHSAANLASQKTFFPRGENSVNPIDYAVFLDIPKEFLSSLFGLKVKTIMIDPGHGGSDVGCIGEMGTYEKDITLDIAKRLKERLKQHGYKVLMTREDDITLPLAKRVEIAQLSKADMFISIHLNYLTTKPINIIETYFFGPPSDETTLKLAERENSDSQYGLSDFKKILEKMEDALKYQESSELAISIQKNLFSNVRKENKKVKDYGVKRAPFVVLLGVDVPAVLTEVSCLSNIEEEIRLNTEGYRENIAYYLEAGMLDYLNKRGEKYEAKRR